jgi:hypothetical protein
VFFLGQLTFDFSKRDLYCQLENYESASEHNALIQMAYFLPVFRKGTAVCGLPPNSVLASPI